MPYKDPKIQSEYSKKWRLLNRDRDLKRQRDNRQKKRLAILTYYGNGKRVCSCCLEDKIEFLSLDHINGGGTEQKRLLKSRDIYLILSKEKLHTGQYPDGYRILCHNCNQSYGFYGYCPHKSESSSVVE